MVMIILMILTIMIIMVEMMIMIMFIMMITMIMVIKERGRPRIFRRCGWHYTMWPCDNTRCGHSECARERELRIATQIT
jgi:hypothetical protein